MKIEITDPQVNILLRVLGKEKARLSEGNFFSFAHELSDLLASIRDQLFEQATTN
jgi:hypothetical protein